MRRIGLMVLAITALFAGLGWAADCRFRGAGVAYTPHYVAPAFYYPPVTIGPATGGESEALLEQTKLTIKLFEAYKAQVEEKDRLLKAFILSGGKGGISPTFAEALLPPHPGLEVLNNRCASCHDVSTKANGKGFAFLNAGQFIDEGVNMQKVMKAIIPDRSTGKAFMPPPSRKPLNGDEGFAISTFFAELPEPKRESAPVPVVPPTK